MPEKTMLHLNFSDHTHYTKITIVGFNNNYFPLKNYYLSTCYQFYNYPICMKNTMMLKLLMMMKTKANTIIQNGFLQWHNSLLLHIQANNKQTTFTLDYCVQKFDTHWCHLHASELNSNLSSQLVLRFRVKLHCCFIFITPMHHERDKN